VKLNFDSLESKEYTLPYKQKISVRITDEQTRRTWLFEIAESPNKFFEEEKILRTLAHHRLSCVLDKIFNKKMEIKDSES
jgi:hypothetical protein